MEVFLNEYKDFNIQHVKKELDSHMIKNKIGQFVISRELIGRFGNLQIIDKPHMDYIFGKEYWFKQIAV